VLIGKRPAPYRFTYAAPFLKACCIFSQWQELAIRFHAIATLLEGYRDYQSIPKTSAGLFVLFLSLEQSFAG